MRAPTEGSPGLPQGRLSRLQLQSTGTPKVTAVNEFTMFQQFGGYVQVCVIGGRLEHFSKARMQWRPLLTQGAKYA